MTSAEREVRAFIEHANDMAERCEREAEDMDRCGLPDVARQLRRQRTQWIRLGKGLNRTALDTPPQPTDDDIPFDLEGATA